MNNYTVTSPFGNVTKFAEVRNRGVEPVNNLYFGHLTKIHFGADLPVCEAAGACEADIKVLCITMGLCIFRRYKTAVYELSRSVVMPRA